MVRTFFRSAYGVSLFTAVAITSDIVFNTSLGGRVSVCDIFLKDEVMRLALNEISKMVNHSAGS